MRSISNNPIERQLITYPWTYWDNAFTEDELQKLEEYLSKFELLDAPIVGKKTTETPDKGTVNSDIRKSSIKFHQFCDENKWIFDRINYAATQINDKYYNFDLNGYSYFQYTEYYDYQNGKYEFHSDLITNRIIPNEYEQRKLSMTLLINDPEKDFDGGNFMINHDVESNAEIIPSKKGRMIFFPSFMLHKVSPVTRGTRKSIVVWIVGPKFK